MFRLEYRSDEVVIGTDLYAKCLGNACRFDRAVGFFASTAFAICPQAFGQFFSNHGRMRIVCCPILDRRDIDAIYHGYRERPSLIRKPRFDILSGNRASVLQEVGALTAWLVASGRLEIRIALRESSKGSHIYHEKLGLFGDENSNVIAFSGSANESLSGLEGNFESVDVFRSWVPAERRRVDQKLHSFEMLWKNETPGVQVLSFTDAATRGKLKARTSSPERETRDVGNGDTAPSFVDLSPLGGIEEVLIIPGEISLKKHQREAIKQWFAAKGHGVLVMATGAGKTITALATAVKLYEWANAPLFVVIVCPYLHLCVQWVEEAKRFGLDPLLCAMDRRDWYDPLSTRLFNLLSGNRQVVSVVVSNATFASRAFQSLLDRAPPTALFIADEVHHFGAPELRVLLPAKFPFRLGLSATPERFNDPEGTSAIEEYFGDPVSHYSLREALRDGVLCPYRYFPVVVELHEDELDEYLELTRKIGQALGTGDTDQGGTPYLDALLLRRSRLLATARGKIPALIERMSPLSHSSHNLVYCGDGTVAGDAGIEIIRHVDAVVRALGRDLGMTVAKYVADTPLTGRSQLRKRFAEGRLQGLVAIRCLDEGVDVPETRRAFILASSTNPRQFIQRRGRILRRSPGKEMAEIYDFIVAPSSVETDPDSPFFPLARRLFRRELGRIMEFASLAVNGPEALNALLPLRANLNLLDFGVEDEPRQSGN